jgi:hypothetical protein
MVDSLAYFTDPMGDEFKKAMEEGFKEMEREKKKPPKTKTRRKAGKSTKRKKAMKRLSRKTRESLK